ncbi:MAG: hypothetical protein AAF849_22875, partial [Bacteroidota bacterium]
ALGEQVLRYFSLEKVLCPPKADCDFSASISTKISCQEPLFIHPSFLKAESFFSLKSIFF